MPRLHDLAELRFGGVVEAGDAHVEGEIAGGPADGLRHPELKGGEGVIGAGGAAHFDERGGAADERGAAGGFVVVLGERAHEGQVDVDVRVDEAGENIFAGGVNDLGAGRRGEIRGRCA